MVDVVEHGSMAEMAKTPDLLSWRLKFEDGDGLLLFQGPPWEDSKFMVRWSLSAAVGSLGIGSSVPPQRLSGAEGV